jgi:hypothetical protein
MSAKEETQVLSNMECGAKADKAFALRPTFHARIALFQKARLLVSESHANEFLSMCA